ncbi:MAG: PIN domain-containing protein [Solirubrobacteraceae bacterium]
MSAAISPSGPPRQILAAWVQERFELIASPALLDELVDVLARPEVPALHHHRRRRRVHRRSRH